MRRNGFSRSNEKLERGGGGRSRNGKERRGLEEGIQAEVSLSFDNL